MSERTRNTMGQSTDTMNPSSDTMSRAAHPIDDDEVARLVRDVAAGWSMPPVRLDAPGWRERVRGPRARRAASVKGWLGRLGQAAAAGVVLTVGAALVAVYLTGPTGPGAPSHGPATPGSTPGAAATSLPELLVNGNLPSPSRLLVQNDNARFAVIDLATGKLGSNITAGSYGSRMTRTPAGDLVCLCVTASATTYGQSTHVKVTLERFDAATVAVSRTVVLEVDGAPDPRYGAIPQQPGHVSSWTSFSADGRFAYVGWAARAHPSWTSGIVVVSLADGSIVQRLELPSTSTGTMDLGVYLDAPRVVGQGGDGRAVIARGGYRWGPVLSSNADYRPFSEALVAVVEADGGLGEPATLQAASDCGHELKLAGPLADGGTWLSCQTYGIGVGTTIRRLDSDGSKAGDTVVSSPLEEGSTSVISPDGAAVYIWNASALELNRVDLATGNVSKAKAPGESASSRDPLLALGRWLAPPALAKMFLQPGIAISPDGTRVYGLGIVGDPAAHDFSGSAGVVVFDTESMTALGRWEPTADFVSIAVSPDGSLVYATAMSEVDAAGRQTGQPASITVFNAADGSIRLIAGSLGRGMLSLVDARLN